MDARSSCDRRLLRDVLLGLVVKAVLLVLLWRLFFAAPPPDAAGVAGIAGRLSIIQPQGGSVSDDRP